MNATAYDYEGLNFEASDFENTRKHIYLNYRSGDSAKARKSDNSKQLIARVRRFLGWRQIVA